MSTGVQAGDGTAGIGRDRSGIQGHIRYDHSPHQPCHACMYLCLHLQGFCVCKAVGIILRYGTDHVIGTECSVHAAIRH